MANTYYKIDDTTYYIPLKRSIITSSQLLDEEKIETILGPFPIDKPYIDTERPEGRIYNEKYSVIPKSIQIYPTSGCNLRCRYCFSDSGNVECRDLSLEKIKKFISECFKTVYTAQIISGRKDHVEIQFCGGGEPTFHWKLFEDAVNYIEDMSSKYNIPRQIKLTSNCCNGNIKQLQFIGEHIDHLHVSFDGDRDVQNFQRPAANDRESFDLVFNAVKYLVPLIKERGGKCSIRATVTGYSVGKMEQLTEFFCREFPKVDFIQFEPLNWVRKTDRVGDLEAPDVGTYADNYIKSCFVGSRYGMEVVSSYGEISNVRPREGFCDSVFGYSLVLNQDGDIVNCAEASRDNQRTYHKFLVGHLDDNLHFEWFDTPHIEVDDSVVCHKCFAWYHCSGGCLHSVLDYEVNRKYRCELAKEIIKRKIECILDGQFSKIFLDAEIYENAEYGARIYMWKGRKRIQKEDAC